MSLLPPFFVSTTLPLLSYVGVFIASSVGVFYASSVGVFINSSVGVFFAAFADAFPFLPSYFFVVAAGSFVVAITFAFDFNLFVATILCCFVGAFYFINWRLHCFFWRR